MEVFNKAKAVRLRAHNDKYLVADDDNKTIRQSRNRTSRKTIWVVEPVSDQGIRLKSLAHGRYLSASDLPFLLGMTGNKVVQVEAEKGSSEWTLKWEPVREGFQVKLKSWCGTYLRGNGGTPPWRNSVTHDQPHSSTTGKWILWDVEVVDHLEFDGLGSFSSFASDEPFGSEPPTPLHTKTAIHHSSTVMDLFRNAKTIRLRSHHKKYLSADEDEESVVQDRNGSSKNVRWAVEFVSFSDAIIRLKSCYGKYLMASNQPFLLGMTGRKVMQARPERFESSLEWEPVKDGSFLRLKTRYGNYLRANGGVPPWRNSVTHDIPHRAATKEWILWDLDVVDIETQSSVHKTLDHPPYESSDPDSPLELDSISSSVSQESARPSTAEYNVCGGSNSPPKSEGRRILFQFADENGEDENSERNSLNFNGKGVEELTRKLEEDMGIEGVVVCTRSPLNGKLYPIRLQLPPNNGTLKVVLVLKSSTYFILKLPFPSKSLPRAQLPHSLVRHCSALVDDIAPCLPSSSKPRVRMCLALRPARLRTLAGHSSFRIKKFIILWLLGNVRSAMKHHPNTNAPYALHLKVPCAIKPVSEEDQSNRPICVGDQNEVLEKSQLEAIASSSEIHNILNDEKLRKFILAIDSSLDPETELDKAMEDEAFRIFSSKGSTQQMMMISAKNDGFMDCSNAGGPSK
ncbi:uncharacterized protein E5676_scaffold807G00230 [Cucumis melo var. makuwa]|uniref:DUF569 domain-containing protein n=1 Tax=Cucumis melo var. makuwa TaxID=1194695 RepID=A0A5D3CJI3_CUCMM|nr:uncharacterized protein E5676_scaffold807G00230 [Cucumis melo var. makuwa]